MAFSDLCSITLLDYLTKGLIICSLLAQALWAKPLDVTKLADRDLHRSEIDSLQTKDASPTIFAYGHLYKRNLSDDICGKAEEPGLGLENEPAVEHRNADTWKKYGIDKWLTDFAKPFTVCEWRYDCSNKDDDDPTNLAELTTKKYQDWQTWTYSQAGPEGMSKCEAITKGCDPDAAFELCQPYPEMHFIIWATRNFANYLNSLKGTLDALNSWLDGMTGRLVSDFYTPREPPTKNILPLAIVSGVFSAITALAPIGGKFAFAAGGAVVAGVSSIFQGILTQDQLNAPEPIDLWTEIQPQTTDLWEAIVTKLEDLYNSLLLEPIGDGQYVDSPGVMGSYLKDGKFAELTPLSVFNPMAKGAMATAPINALWALDGVFVLKVSDRVLGGDKGIACKTYPQTQSCISGVAYHLIRWRQPQGTLDQSPGDEPIGPDNWNVWGAYSYGKDSPDGTPNANRLQDYGLSLDMIVKSAEKTQAANGGKPFPPDPKAAAQKMSDQFFKDPGTLVLEDMIQWHLPVCDLEQLITSQGYDHMAPGNTESDDSTWTVTVPCTCLTWANWPVDEDSYKIPGDWAGRPSKDGRRCGGWVKKGESDNR